LPGVAVRRVTAPVYHGRPTAHRGENVGRPILVWAYGGPNSIVYTDGKTYVGNDEDMVAAHTGLNITSAQYTYFLTNIVVPALTSNGVKNGTGGAASPDDVGTCFAPVLTATAFVASIVGH
jgi:hypothetical protein